MFLKDQIKIFDELLKSNKVFLEDRIKLINKVFKSELHQIKIKPDPKKVKCGNYIDLDEQIDDYVPDSDYEA